MEAMLRGLPVVCLDWGGPGILVNETCGFKVRADQDVDSVVRELANAVGLLASDPQRRITMGLASQVRVREFSFDRVASRMGY